MGKVSGNDQFWKKAEVETSYNCPLFLQPQLQEMLSSGLALNQQLPFSKLELFATTFPASLTISLRDGRTWSQTIDAREADPFMHFTTTDGWRQSELDVLRRMREALVIALVSHHLTSAKLEPVTPVLAEAV